MEAITVALISGLCVAIPSIITTVLSNKNNNNLIKYQINELSERVNKHNQLIERVYKLEKANAVHKEEYHHLVDKIEHLEVEKR